MTELGSRDDRGVEKRESILILGEGAARRDATEQASEGGRGRVGKERGGEARADEMKFMCDCIFGAS